MNRGQIGQLARLGLAMPGRLRRAVTHDAARLSADILERVGHAGPGLDVAAEIWRSAGTIVVVREAPRMSSGAKLLRHLDPGGGGP